MPKVFISGSITIKQLAPQVEARLDNIRAAGLQVLVGDAAGVDSAIQRYFRTHDYAAVTVYCSSDTARHNLGGWPQLHVEPPAGARGRALHTAKDVRMADDCDYGLMVWDGKSPGTLSNVIELLGRNKKSLLYLYPHAQFHTLQAAADLQALVALMDEPARLAVERKLALTGKLSRLLGSTRDPASEDDAASVQTQIDEHRARIAWHQQCIAELQGRLASLEPLDDLFGRLQ
ncbi:hypothetical protein [Pseudomonas sp. UFMG81]|uniref:hypothetical protein n=1 Tax=Pseudomonas sp. UFMG81 TaxID=2745936 RepID=UPI00188E0749|nr:hypothetical protein [Pseudomonas sp. UFMG81]